MAYIGQSPSIGNFQVCDAISVVNGQAAYTMQVSSVNVVPETANHMIVSLNGIIQAPGSSYTVAGSTITFASNLVTGDVINFIHILGSVLDLGVPSDDTVTAAKLGANAVTGAKLNTDVISAQTALATEPADTDEFLVSDAGVLKRIDYSLIKGGGTHVLLSTTTISSGVSTVDITSNIDSTYKKYMIDVIGMHIATDDQNINIRVFNSSIETGSVYSQFSIDGNQTSATPGGVATQDTGVGITIGLSVGSVDIESFNSRIFLNNPSEAVLNKLIEFSSVYHDSSEKSSYTAGVGNCTDVAAITGIRFYTSSGNIDGGVIRLYGIT
jgi:hypothetical protein